jgi:hypothetical protein
MLDGIHAYEITDRPGVRLYVGVRPGTTRPTVWIEQVVTDPVTGNPATGSTDAVVLASFHGEKQARVLTNFLDAMVGQINRAIEHFHGETGDTSE